MALERGGGIGSAQNTSTNSIVSQSSIDRKNTDKGRFRSLEVSKQKLRPSFNADLGSERSVSTLKSQFERARDQHFRAKESERSNLSRRPSVPKANVLRMARSLELNNVRNILSNSEKIKIAIKEIRDKCDVPVIELYLLEKELDNLDSPDVEKRSSLELAIENRKKILTIYSAEIDDLERAAEECSTKFASSIDKLVILSAKEVVINSEMSRIFDRAASN